MVLTLWAALHCSLWNMKPPLEERPQPAATTCSSLERRITCLLLPQEWSAEPVQPAWAHVDSSQLFWRLSVKEQTRDESMGASISGPNFPMLGLLSCTTSSLVKDGKVGWMFKDKTLEVSRAKQPITYKGASIRLIADNLRDTRHWKALQPHWKLWTFKNYLPNQYIL